MVAPPSLSESPAIPSTDLIAATPDEITEALSYALRYDARGKPRPTGGQMVASLAAERLMEHLKLAGFVLMRWHPAPLHSAG
ncbi:hypothetical protein IBL26_25215 [Roseomonas aerophila]|uniref:Uncharacterized protein n=1 Tax=Teichococcus aerophilus TaxID=1224513 RepID=A0ABR7RVK9_9PROT|nr:hypothetical protein [Pseudoroseomonas aerophila]MBC9210144.1 hypothetical protein [Pseudoroseomonas aerophila]